MWQKKGVLIYDDIDDKLRWEESYKVQSERVKDHYCINGNSIAVTLPHPLSESYAPPKKKIPTRLRTALVRLSQPPKKGSRKHMEGLA